MVRPRIATLLLVLAGSCLFEANATNAQFIGQGNHQQYANGLGQLLGFKNSGSAVQSTFSHDFNVGHQAQQAHQHVLHNLNTILTNSGPAVTGHASGFKNTVNIGGVGFSAGLASDEAGRVGVVRTPNGGLQLNVGALSFGLGHIVDVETGTVVKAQSNVNGVQTSSESSTYSQEHSSEVVAVTQSVSNGQQQAYAQNYDYIQQPQQPQQPQQQTEQQYYDQYYKDYYNNYYQTHPQYRPEAQQPQAPVQQQQYTPVQPAPVQTPYQPEPQPQPTVAQPQPSVPVQPSDPTHFQDHYNHNSPYLLTSYASENYFNQPAAPAEPNYYIAPSVETPTAHPEPQTTVAQNEQDLDGILNNVFLPVTQATPSDDGKSLFDLLDTLPDSDPAKNEVAGGDYGLDVRSESRRKRSLIRPARRAYRYHYEDEDSDEDSDEDDRYHHHHHHHSAGRNHGHGHGRGHHGCNGRGNSHHHTTQPDQNQQQPSTQPDIRPIHENTGEEPIEQRPFGRGNVPLAPFPSDLPTTTTTIPPPPPPTTVAAAPRDLSPEYNFDVRSSFNETRRKRDLSLVRDKRDGDSLVFFGDDGADKPVESPSTAAPAAAPPAAGAADEEEFEECELGEDDCEPASLDNRFGFATGMRRRRPIAVIIGGIVHSIIDSGNQHNRDYPQQPQYPQQPPQYGQPSGQHQQYPHSPTPHRPPPQQQSPHSPTPHRPPPQQQSPHSPTPHRPPLQQQSPHSPTPHRPPLQQQYPGNGPHYQQSGANAQSESFQDQYGPYTQSQAGSQTQQLGHGGHGGSVSGASSDSTSGSYGGGAGSHSTAGSGSYGSGPELYGDLPVFG